MIQKQKIIAIVGPTASGKSSLGIYLAKKLGGEVISADSRQVYRGLNIGTGKVTKREMQGVPHHLIDVASPRRQFTVDQFASKATVATTTIYRSGGVPIVVGGTGLYVDTFLGRMSYPAVPPNKKLRTQLERQTTKQLFAQLQKLDPQRANTIEPEHKRRLIRAIEIAKTLGHVPPPSPSDAWRYRHDVLWLGLNPKDLHKRIKTRLKARMRAGMIAEAKRLHQAGLSYKRMDMLGLEYRYLAKHLQGSLSKAQLEQELERAIQKYAKRQNKWFKRNKDIIWVKDKTKALQLAKSFLSR